MGYDEWRCNAPNGLVVILSGPVLFPECFLSSEARYIDMGTFLLKAITIVAIGVIVFQGWICHDAMANTSGTCVAPIAGGM